MLAEDAGGELPTLVQFTLAPGGKAMGLINWIFDFYQQSRIDQLRDETARTRAEASRVTAVSGSVDLVRLERAIGELALAVKTLQRVAVEKGLCTSEEFYQKLRAIDLEDGQADNRATLP